MNTSLISPLSAQECISRLEEARDKQAGPLRCSVSSRTFTLRKKRARFAASLRGELSASPQGTVINCSLEIEGATDNLNSLWLVGALPLLTCLALGLLLNGFLNGFSKELILIFLIVSVVPTLYLVRRQLGIRQTERDRQAMLDFIQKTLDAKPGLP